MEIEGQTMEFAQRRWARICPLEQTSESSLAHQEALAAESQNGFSSRPVSRSTPRPRASPPRTSTTSRARAVATAEKPKADKPETYELETAKPEAVKPLVDAPDAAKPEIAIEKNKE